MQPNRSLEGEIAVDDATMLYSMTQSGIQRDTMLGTSVCAHGNEVDNDTEVTNKQHMQT